MRKTWKGKCALLSFSIMQVHALATAEKTGILLAPAENEAFPALFDASRIRALLVQRTNLAVLSACSTQKGGSGGTINDPDSLAGAFLQAGVPHVVASRWDVDSTVTAYFMKAFYDSLLRGKPVSRSLREAQASVRSIPGSERPYYWASFSAFGKI